MCARSSFYHGVACYWIKAYDFIPNYYSNGKTGISSGTSSIFTLNELYKYLIINILNSSIFYWWWTLFSDGFHVTQEEIKIFPLIDVNNLSESKKNNIINVGKELMLKYQGSEDYKEMIVLGKKVKIQSIEPYKYKDILLKIDDLICKIYDLDFDYFVKFDNEFRYKMKF